MKLIKIDNGFSDYHMVNDEPIKENDWYLMTIDGKYGIWSLGRLGKGEENEAIRWEFNKVIASTKLLEGIPSIILHTIIEALNEGDLQSIIDKRNTPDRYSSVMKRYNYTEQDIKDIVEEYKEASSFKEKGEWNVEIEKACGCCGLSKGNHKMSCDYTDNTELNVRIIKTI